jgi:hypothetical protein
MTTLAHASKKTKKSGINKRRASPIHGQGDALQVNNEPDNAPRWAYKESVWGQVPAWWQAPSQQQRPALPQAPMMKGGRIEHDQKAEEHSQRAAAAHATTHFHTPRPPD